MDFMTFIVYISIYIGLIATTFYALSFFSAYDKKKLLFSDKELPKVSVVIPIFNEEKSIEKTLKSIIGSDYPRGKLEIIVVNDGSTDDSLEIAKKFKSKMVKIFSKTNGGKGTALNFGIKRAKGDFVFSMDADTFVEPWSVKEMMRYFKNPEVMCVTPAMVIYKPKSFLQKIQHVEYLLGLFLRKAFTSVNAMHITPGAFSVYRKKFFDKHGLYEVGNITEDLEMSFRVQYHGYVIENSPESPAYTIAPKKFFELMKQRRRWYYGLMKNTWKYKKIIVNPEYGDLGMFVIPIAWISIFFSVFVTAYLFFKTIFDVKDELFFLRSINFDFSSVFNLNSYAIERFLFLFFTNPVVIFILFFAFILGLYLFYGAKKLENVKGWGFGLPLFFMFFAVLFGFWWIISIFHVLFNRKVSWR